MIITASPVHTKVFAVSILSLARYQVSNGNTKYDEENPKNLALQREFVSPTINLLPYHQHNPVGIAYKSTARKGLSFHQSQMNCELIWNHIKVCPMANTPTPAKILKFISL